MSQAWPFTKADQWHAACMLLFCAMIRKVGLLGKGVTCGLNTSSALSYGCHTNDGENRVKVKIHHSKLFIFVG